MKFLIVSSFGGGTALGYRLTKEGHQVKMWIKNKDYRTVGNGFFQKIDNLDQWKKWADLIIFDDGEFGELVEKLKSEGLNVWGGSKWSDSIELDRGLGQNTLKSVGMTVLRHWEFSSLEDGISFVKSNPGRYVAKPSGAVQGEKALTYLGKEDNGSDMVTVLEHYKEKWAAQIDKFELQEFKKGIEVGISGFFNGADFVEPIEVTFEHKKLMAGDIGPGTWEMGTSMVWMNKNFIYKESIGRMVNLLKEHKYLGYLDINCIATEKSLYPLEFTSRFGYPTIMLKMETIKSNMGDWMYRLSKGEKKNFAVANPYAICVTIATPPFPFDSKEIYKQYGEDQQIIFKTKDKTGYWPGQLYSEKGEWFVTGGLGFSVIVTGSGKSMKEAKELAYKRVDNVNLPNSFWRNDISDNTEQQLLDLNRWGYFRP